MSKTQEMLGELLRYGMGITSRCHIETFSNWGGLFELAMAQGVAAIALDGINRCFENGVNLDIDFQTKMDWIGEVTQMEQQYQQYEKNLLKLGTFYQKHGINMMVLKGYGLSLNYPIPSHRPCGDIDIYLFGEQERADAEMVLSFKIQDLEFNIDKSHHHHTVFQFQWETVENHYDFLNVHVRPSNKRIEKKLKEIANKNNYQEFENLGIISTNTNLTDDTNIILPSVEFNAIYLLRHCVGHFASTEMTLRQALDWGFFMEKHHKDLNWNEYIPYLKDEGMYRFYNLLGLFCMSYLGFDASIFHGLVSDKLFDRFSNEILEPEFKDHENGNLLWSLWVKPRRWWHNRWKNRLCYKESAWEEFAYGLWAKILKPSHFW